MTPNPLSDALHFLVKPAFPTVIYWLLLIGSIAIALYAWRNIPSQRSWRNVGDWLCRFFVGTMWWQQTLWKLPPLYTDNPSDPLNTGLHYWIEQPKKDSKYVTVCEGWATGRTILRATGYPTVMAFNGSNLKAVAEYVRKKYPDADIVIAADDDWKVKASCRFTLSL